MRVLVLGGTVFLGRHVVDAALARGDEVTILHRGTHPAHRPGEVAEVLGDRADGFAAVAGTPFDAVVDTSGYRAADTDRAAREIDAGHYVFVSTVSVYADPSGPLTESSPVHEPPAAEVTEVAGELYGPQKVGAERALRAVRGESALIVRAGLLVGPHDPTDRFTHWATRFMRPGPVLAPDVADRPVQVLDARDLAAWMLHAAEAGVTGTMNAAGARGITFGDMLSVCAAAAGTTTADVRWIDEQRLLDAGVQPWTEVPLWLPTAWGAAGLMDVSVNRAAAVGLRARPLADTAHDTLAWATVDAQRVAADDGTGARSAVLTPDREAELLAALT